MSRERRWYWTIQLGVLGGFVGALAVLWSVAIRQVQLLAPGSSDCGCVVAPASWPPVVMIGTGLVVVAVMALSVRFFIAIGRRAWRHNRLMARVLRSHRLVWHHRAQLAYRVIDEPTEQAMTLGLVRPKILVTTGLIRRLRGSELLSVLRHEQAHARGYDPLWSMLLEAVGETVGWIGGVRPIINSAFSLREVLADTVATKNYTRVDGLSGAIAKLARPIPPHVVPAFSPNNDRVNKLLNHRWQLPLPRLRWPTLALGLLVAGGIFAASHLPAATVAAQPTLPAEACWLRQTMCAGAPTSRLIFMSPTGVMSRYDW